MTSPRWVTASTSCPPFSSRTRLPPPGPHPTHPPLIPLATTHPGHFAHGSDRHMVRLEDVFQRFPRIPVSLEVKEENEELINKVVLQAGVGAGRGWREA